MFNNLRQVQSPLHLILTKWDMLERDNTIEKIIGELYKFEPFQRFVAFHRHAGIICRLIPVSVTGPNYVQYDGVDMVPGWRPAIRARSHTSISRT